MSNPNERPVSVPVGSKPWMALVPEIAKAWQSGERSASAIAKRLGLPNDPVERTLRYVMGEEAGYARGLADGKAETPAKGKSAKLSTRRKRLENQPVIIRALRELQAGREPDRKALGAEFELGAGPIAMAIQYAYGMFDAEEVGLAEAKKMAKTAKKTPVATAEPSPDEAVIMAIVRQIQAGEKNFKPLEHELDVKHTKFTEFKAIAQDRVRRADTH